MAPPCSQHEAIRLGSGRLERYARRLDVRGLPRRHTATGGGGDQKLKQGRTARHRGCGGTHNCTSSGTTPIFAGTKAGSMRWKANA